MISKYACLVMAGVLIGMFIGIFLAQGKIMRGCYMQGEFEASHMKYECRLVLPESGGEE